jgi:hypothetical protein
MALCMRGTEPELGRSSSALECLRVLRDDYVAFLIYRGTETAVLLMLADTDGTNMITDIQRGRRRST